MPPPGIADQVSQLLHRLDPGVNVPDVRDVKGANHLAGDRAGRTVWTSEGFVDPAAMGNDEDLLLLDEPGRIDEPGRVAMLDLVDGDDVAPRGIGGCQLELLHRAFAATPLSKVTAVRNRLNEIASHVMEMRSGLVLIGRAGRSALGRIRHL